MSTTHDADPLTAPPGTQEASGGVPPKQHPLGPLTAREILQTSNLVRGCWPGDIDCHFKVVTLLEPTKAELVPRLTAERAGQNHGITIDRRAFVVYYFRGTVSQNQETHILSGWLLTDL